MGVYQLGTLRGSRRSGAAAGVFPKAAGVGVGAAAGAPPNENDAFGGSVGAEAGVKGFPKETEGALVFEESAAEVLESNWNPPPGAELPCALAVFVVGAAAV
jgi:hypothetical protein